MAFHHHLFSLLFLLYMASSILSRTIPAGINVVAAGEEANKVSMTTSSSSILGDNLIGSRKGQTAEGLHQVKQYLARFGYLDNYHYSSDDSFFDESLETALKTYQLNYNLKVTGEIDSQTLEQMEMARCGVADIINRTTRMRSGGGGGGKNNFSSHYAYFPSKPIWPADKTHLTFGWLLRHDIDPLYFVPTRDAFQRWAAVSHFTFEEVVDLATADIKIGFFKGDHGDGYTFDGRGQILAHSFAPTSGMLHLDSDERWSTNPGHQDYDLESVLVHEIGHTLGLAHSSVKEAIMWPTFGDAQRKVDLNQDDIDGIQSLYK